MLSSPHGPTLHYATPWEPVVYKQVRRFHTMLKRLLQILHSDDRKLHFGGVDISAFCLPPDIHLHSDVSEYLSTCIPDAYARIPGLGELLPQSEITFCNVNVAPSRYLLPLGFVAISSRDGDCVTFDGRTGDLFMIDHLTYSKTDIRVCKGKQQNYLPLTYDNVRATALPYAGNAVARTLS